MRLSDIKYCCRGKHHLHRDQFTKGAPYCRECMREYRKARKIALQYSRVVP